MKYNQKGGAFTGNQLYGLFESGYRQDESIAKKSINIIPLDKSNPKLFNKTFQVFFDPDIIRFIVIHRGTSGDSTKELAKDWGNNFRNTLFGNKKTENSKIFSELLMTDRQKIAEDGHKELIQYLENLYENRNNQLNETQQKIVKVIQQYMLPINEQITDINVSEAVEHLLKEKMSVIGHSQGAVYAYLYGDQGAETIVFNPAPFRGKKPDNVYIIRRIGDAVSILTALNTSKGKRFTELNKLEGKGVVEQHTISSLQRVYTLFGNKFLYSEDLELKNNIPGSSEGFQAVNAEGEIVESTDESTIGKKDEQILKEFTDFSKQEQSTAVVSPVGGKQKKSRSKKRRFLSKKKQTNKKKKTNKIRKSRK